MIILVVGGFMFYIAAFSPFIAVFIILGSIAICLLVAITFQVIKAVFVLGKKIDDVAGDQTEQTGEAKGAVCCCYNFYMNVFDINGKFYLVKMYTSELFEHIIQAYLLQSYLCRMPIEATTLFCFVLVTELSFNLWVTCHLNSQENRDWLILVDIITDIFCVAYPLCYNWFSNYRITPNAGDIVFSTLYPTLSVYSKLYEVWSDYVVTDLQRIQEKKRGSRSSRRRSSILNLPENKEVIKRQKAHFPKYIYIYLNVLFLLFFTAVAFFHLATNPSNAVCNDVLTKEVWKGCRTRIPFCKQVFSASCDCSVLHMINYTQKLYQIRSCQPLH